MNVLDLGGRARARLLEAPDIEAFRIFRIRNAVQRDQLSRPVPALRDVAFPGPALGVDDVRARRERLAVSALAFDEGPPRIKFAPDRGVLKAALDVPLLAPLPAGHRGPA